MKIAIRFRQSIGAKLIVLLTVLLIGSIVSVAWLSTRLFVSDTTDLVRQMNSDTAGGLAVQMQQNFDAFTEKVRGLGIVLLRSPGHTLLKEMMGGDDDLLGVFLQRHLPSGKTQVHSQVLAPIVDQQEELKREDLLGALNGSEFTPQLAQEGEVQIAAVRLNDGSLALALMVPFVQVRERLTHSLLAFVRAQKFTGALNQNSIVTSFIIDRTGRLLLHSRMDQLGKTMQYLPIVQDFIEGKTSNNQKEYIDPETGEARFGSFYAVGFAGLGAIAEVPKATAMGAASRVVYQSALFALIILSISFLLGYFYSSTITSPIRQLMSAAKSISQGNFKTRFHPKTIDEIGQLGQAFNDMAMGLEERERVKAVFNKFHNKEIAEKLLSGEVRLGGEKRKATIFFSDVRGFTALSETMSPEQVLEMLNEYMTRMVSVIREHGGVVDKYVGDAIMALWGVPVEGPQDTEKAVRACLRMRQELEILNDLRVSRGQPALKIGMGLNFGEVVAGNVGSEEKMEYTVLGDSVNLASRIESMTKEYGTDLLISKSVFDEVGHMFMTESCTAKKVKGKSSAVQVFRVLGYKNAAGEEVRVETPYSSYAIEKSDKVSSDEAA